MAEQTFDDFYRDVQQAPTRALKRFQALQFAGDEREKMLLGQWRRQQGAAWFNEPLQGLDWLRVLDNRAALDQVQCPVLQVFGERDALVPIAAAKAFAARWPDHRVAVIDGAAHVPFQSAPEQFWDAVLAFLPGDFSQLASLIDKRAVARSFGRAAQTYDRVAELQRSVADAVLERVPQMKADTVLDLGCGTGYSLPALRARFPHAQLLAADLAEGMLAYARRQPQRQADAWLCADAEDLPLADDSIDLLFSSLSVQWCENSGALFAEAYRVLRPGGHCVLSTLGPDTLVELRDAWREVDAYTHVNRFPERASLQQAIAASGLHIEQWQEQPRVLSYRKLGELTAELKELGAHNLNSGRPGGLTGRRRLRAFTEAYERFRRNDGQLPASYQVWMLVLRKPHA